MSIWGGHSDGINAWWKRDPSECYWLDVTQRDDRDQFLASPRGEGLSSTFWKHRLITHVRGGDIVFHYDVARDGIVAASATHGRIEKRPLWWPMAVGHEGGPRGRRLPSWGIGLRQSTRLDAEVSLAEVARVQWDLYPALRALEDEVGDPLHYPFEMGNREAARPVSGYVLKLPAILVKEIPALARASARWNRPQQIPHGAPIPMPRMQRAASRSASAAIVALALAFLVSASPARAQFNSFAPPFAKLTGGYLWGSLGYRDVRHPEGFYFNDRHPFVRGGFAAMFGPFGGQPDTTVTLDSVRTAVEWSTGTASVPGAVHLDTVRTVHSLRSHHTLPGRDGWVSLAVGYEYSGACRVDLHDDRGTLSSTFPLGGFYASAFFGPFPLMHMSRFAFWYATLGASVSQVSQANGTSNDTLVRFDSEKALAPEASVLVGWKVHRGVRVLTGISAQHVRWSSLRYRTPAETALPDATLRQLPDGLRLTTLHLSLGVSFDASDLFGR